MKFLTDADSPHSLIWLFSRHNHEAVHVRDALGSATDERIFEYANKNMQVIVTRDLGFAEKFIESKGFGLILVRLPYYFTVDRINRVFEEFLNDMDPDKAAHHITVLELGRYRTKKL